MSRCECGAPADSIKCDFCKHLPNGLGSAQLEALRVLRTQGEVHMQEIVEETDRTKRTIRSALRRLRERGLVKRRRDPSDARRSLFRLGDDLEPVAGIVSNTGPAPGLVDHLEERDAR